MPDLIPYSIFAFLVNLIAFFILGIITYKMRGWQFFPLLVLLLAINLWTVGQLLEVLVVSVPTMIWANIKYMGLAFVGVAWVLFVYSYYRDDEQPLSKRSWILWVFPLISMILVWTNEFHHLIFTRVIELPGSTLVAYEYGIWFWGSVIFNYSCILLSIYWLLRPSFPSTKIHRAHIIWLVAAMIPPVFGNILYLLDLTPVKVFDLTPVGFAVGILIFGFGKVTSYFLNRAPGGSQDLTHSVSDLEDNHVIENDIRIVLQAIHQSNQSVIITNRDGVIEYVNLFFSQVTGYTREEALGQNPRIVKSGMMSSDFYLDLWQTILAGKTWQGELLNRTKQGDLFWEDTIITPVQDKHGNIEHFVATKTDITRRKHAEKALARSESDLKLLYEISLEFASINDREQLIQAIIHKAPSILGVSTGGLYMVDEDGVTLTLIAGHHVPEGVFEKKIKVGEGLAGKALQTGLPAMVPDYSVWEYRSPLFEEYNLHRALAVPLKTSGRIMGVLNIADSVSTESFNEDDVRLATLFADQAAGALEKVHLLEVSTRRSNQIAAVSRIGQAVTSNLHIDLVIRKLYEQCLQILPLDTFYVATYNTDSGMIEHPLFIDQGEVKEVPPRNIDEMPGLSGEVISQRYTLYIPDTADPQTQKEHQIIHAGAITARSYLGVPLIARGQVVGVISIQSYQPNAYLYEQIQLLETIAVQAAIALENAQLFERMRSMAITDVLTQINTRGHFFELAEIEIIRAIRYGHKLSVIMIDIDRFKDINDTLGHDIGDQTLFCVAQLIKRTFRQVDLIGRYGGEEFAALLPETGLREACLAAERLRRAVEAMVVPGTQKQIHVTISMGIAELTLETRTLETLLKRADQALYRAKETGRNRFSI